MSFPVPRSARIGFLVWVFLLLGVSILHALPDPEDRWIEVQSDHFTLFSNAGTKRTVELARHLELFRDALDQLTVDVADEVPVPVRFYVFRDSEDYVRYAPENTAGYFLSTREANVVAMNADYEQQALRIICHEFTHFWIHRNYPSLPSWLDEGLAEFYSTMQIEQRKARVLVKVGKLIREHIYWIRAHRFLPLETLFRLEPGFNHEMENDLIGSIYAQSWAMIHFCLAGQSRDPEAVRRYMDLVSNGEDPVLAFESAFGMNLEEAETALREYVRKEEYLVLLESLPPADAVGEETVRELGFDEVACRLGELQDLLRKEEGVTGPVESDPALEYFEAAADRNPGNPLAHAWLSRLHARYGDDVAADREFQHAVRLDPEDPEVYRLAGAGIEERIQDPESDQARADWARAADRYRRTLELDPRNYPARVGLGLSYLYRSGADPAEGAKHLRRAFRANPALLLPVPALVLLEARAGEFDRAWALLDTYLRPARNRHAIRESEYRVASLEVARARDLMADGERDAALRRLQSVVARTENPNIRDLAMCWGLRIVGGLEAADSLDVVTYEEIVSLANAGKLQDARRRLEEFRPRIHLDGLKGLAGELSLRIEAELRTQDQERRFNWAVAMIRKHNHDQARKILEQILTEDPDVVLARGIRVLLEDLPD